MLPTALPATASAAGVRLDQTVVAITPDNGGYVEQVPDEVVLTFARPVDDEVEASVTTPDGTTDVQVRVDGTEVAVPVDDAGPGEYTVDVVLGERTSSSVFTVLAEGEQAPVEDAGYGALVIGAVLLAFGLVAVLTFRKLFRR